MTWLRLILNAWNKRREPVRTPGYSWCCHCGRTWDKVPCHNSVAVSSWQGVFCLCDECEPKMTLEQKLAYYRSSYWACWRDMSWSLADLEAAVRAKCKAETERDLVA